MWRIANIAYMDGGVDSNDDIRQNSWELSVGKFDSRLNIFVVFGVYDGSWW